MQGLISSIDVEVIIYTMVTSIPIEACVANLGKVRLPQAKTVKT